MDIEEYNAKFESQNGRCPICNRHQSELKRTLGVDHDHTTGQNRDLLCISCNSGLGCFHEEPSRLEAAIKYLEKWGK